MALVDKIFYHIMAMASDQKIILDQNTHGLKDSLEAVNFNKVYDLSILKLDPQVETDAGVIHKKLKKLGATTPNSSFLFITKNAIHFKNPDNYDVLWVPDKFNPQFLAESIKQWLATQPKRGPKNLILQANKSNSKHTTRYTIEVVNLGRK